MTTPLATSPPPPVPLPRCMYPGNHPRATRAAVTAGRPHAPGRGSALTVMTLPAGRWTLLPATNVMVRWDGDHEIAVYQHGGIWDLPPLTARRGVVWGWLALANHPELGPWPIMPLTASRRNLYHAETAAPAEPVHVQNVPPVRSPDDLIQPGMFDSDAELDEFLIHYRNDRQR